MKIPVVKVILKTEYEIELPFNENRVFGVETAGPIFCKTIGSNNVEYISMLCLDNVNKIINYSNLAIGTISDVNLQLAQLMKVALLSNTSKIIIAHNHPSGILKFTSFDIQLTKKIGALCKFFNIELIDSLVVDDRFAKSIREHLGDEMNG